jgi:hypothetical protein
MRSKRSSLILKEAHLNEKVHPVNKVALGFALKESSLNKAYYHLEVSVCLSMFPLVHVR